MGRNSGGVNGYSKVGATMVGVTSTGKKLTAKQTATVQSSSESLDSLKHREVTKQLNRAISRYEKVMGVRERTIRVADTPGAYGVTFLNSNGSQGIYLSKSLFNQSRNKIEADYRKQNYDTGFKNKTNRPIQHTLTHELAHATWTSAYDAPKYKAAGKEISSLYKKWSKDKKKQGYGSYGKSNVDEFWAEVVTKGVHGKSDKYTRKAISIAHSYKL
jgi:hypothetical protein